MNDLINARCGWAGTDELYVKYHDEEWGKPVDDDRILFEFLVLESAQAGLSWITILRKREGYRKAFHRFDPERVAQMTPEYSYSFAKDKMGLSTLLRIRALLLSRPAADRQRFQEPEPDSRHLARIGRNEPGHEKERIQILRIDDLLRLLAGHGVRERPPDGLPLQRRPATDGPLSITPPHDRHDRRERSARQGRTIIASPKTSRIRFSPNTLSRYRSMSHCKRRNRKQSV